MGIKGRFKSIDDAYRQYISDLVVPEAAKTQKMADMARLTKPVLLLVQQQRIKELWEPRSAMELLLQVLRQQGWAW